MPRDLETICLKCLHKEPERRYATAAALADDLTRFHQGRPIRARPPGPGGRLWRWGRREPVAAALVATAMALVALAVGGGLWHQRQQAESRAMTARQEGRTWEAAEGAIKHAADLGAEDRWPEARAALAAAPNLRDTPAPADLKDRLGQALRDADMAAKLEDIRLRLSEGTAVSERASPLAHRLYATAFREYGIDPAASPPAAAAARVRHSAIRQVLLVFLHDWLYWVPDANREALRAVVELSDDDPWRRAFREALLIAEDTKKLRELAVSPEGAAQPPAIISGLGGTLLAAGHDEEAWALLHAAQRRHPGDFWINFLLGHLLQLRQRPAEAVAYLRAAVGLRPGSDQAHTFLGRALRDGGDTDGAIAAFREAIRRNPDNARADDLVNVLAPAGRLEEARAAWEEILKRDPPDHDRWHGYAQLCLFLGNEEAYRRARRALLERFGARPTGWITAERTSVACLLMPAADDELRRVAALADRTAAAASNARQRDNPYVQFVKGLSEYRQGRADRALPLLQEAATKITDRAGPRLALAMAQHRSGSTKEARKTLAATVRHYDWNAARADEIGWVSHVLRREAEALILPGPPPFPQARNVPRTVGRDPGDEDEADDRFDALRSGHINPEQMAKVMAAEGRLPEARAAWAKFLESGPAEYGPWYGYAELCLFLGNEPAYWRACAAMLDRFGGTSSDWIIAERTSLACLLLPQAGEDLRRAAALAEHAVAAAAKSAEPDNGYVLFAKGLSEYRQGRFAEAMPLLHESSLKIADRPGPRLVLAMAQHRAGHTNEARRTLAAAMWDSDWDARRADGPSTWVSHVLRREAERLILPNLPAFLRREHEPRDNDERLALSGACQFMELHATRAGLWADALAADPALPANAAREPAVIAAALAGCGHGQDASTLTDADRARWRERAREWLRVELDTASIAWARGGNLPTKARATLAAWSSSPDLAGVRDPRALERLPAAEQREWTLLWERAASLLGRARPDG